MKLCILILSIFLSTSVLAKQLGVGVSVGNPTGLNGKYWLDNNHAVDAGMAYSLGRHSNFSLHSDFLWHQFDAFYLNDVHPLDFYYGVGGRMEFADGIELGVRIPVGLAHRLKESADVFAEAAPIVDFVSRTGLELHLLIGGRFYFN